MAHKVFEKPIRVHFSNCDPAGIVFHPQYFVLINELMEDFLEDVAGVGFIEIRRYGVGFPVVSVKTQFTKPSRPSDRLMGQVWVEKIGDKSIRFAFVLKDEAEERLRCVGNFRLREAHFRRSVCLLEYPGQNPRSACSLCG